MQDSQVLYMRGIKKAFPGVQALNGVDIEIRAGEVMALVGENGAGKSTLIKILSGAYTADEGEIFIKGHPVKIVDPRHAQDLGVSVIYQELNLAEQISVAENIFAGREICDRLGFIDFRVMYKNTQMLLDSLHITNVDPRAEVRQLGIAHKQMVEIAKALSLDANIIVMDEPTSSLPTATSRTTDRNEVQVLLDMIVKLRERGKAVLYISHRMDEVFRISDRITVMRDGKLIGVRKTAETCPDEIIAMMVGRKLEDLYGEIGKRSIGRTMLEVRGLNEGKRLKNIGFKVHSGEILGVSGLVGAGRTEMSRAIFGADQRDSGDIFIDSKPVDIRNPLDAIKAGLGYLPEDRKLQGLFLKMSVCINISAANISRISRKGFIRTKTEKKLAYEYINQLNVRTPSIEQLTCNLSGGNQQKVVIAKWLAVQPKVLIVDEPTRGVDVGAKMEIYHLIRKMAELGMAVLMISSELHEILGMSDRILVLHEGELAGELDRSEATEEKIMAMATGTVMKVSIWPTKN
ncbi:MAG: sugar ABC transporter ATP-binding protein [Anaerolineaceae bacterium]